MKLTSRTEYALLALTHLARHSEEGHMSVDTIAEAQGIPRRFLEQILLTLRRAGIVRSIKGKHGGFELGRAANRIYLAEIVRLFDGPLAPTESVSTNFYSTTPVEREPKLIGVFREIRDFVANKLESTSLADIVGAPRVSRKSKAMPARSLAPNSRMAGR